MTGEELKEIRIKCGLSQEQASEFLGIKRTTLWKYEKTGVVVPNVIARAAEAMKPESDSLALFLGTLSPKEQKLITRRFSRVK